MARYQGTGANTPVHDHAGGITTLSLRNQATENEEFRENGSCQIPGSSPPIEAATKDLDRPPRRSTISEFHHTATLVVVDFLAVGAAVPLALLMLSVVSGQRDNSLAHFDSNLASDAIFPGAVVLALAASGSYHSTRNALRTSIFLYLKAIIFAIGTGCVLAIGVGVLIHVATGMAEPNSTQLLLSVLIAALLVSFGRAVIQTSMNARDTSRVLVVGSGALVDRIGTCLRLHKGMEMVGRVVDAPEPEPGSIGVLRDLRELCAIHDVDRVILAFPDSITRESVTRLRELQDQVHISIVPRYFDLVSFKTRLMDLSGIPMLELAPNRPSRWSRAVKRGFDITVSLTTLIVLGPLFLGIAVAIRLSSAGPVLFRQQRIGREYRTFTVYKFRTMSCCPPGTPLDGSDHAPEDPETLAQTQPSNALHLVHNKAADQNRITRIGRILRRSGLDELPQVFNVLIGDMSVVGPRPLISGESMEITGWRTRRFDVRPGITGLWQVSGRNELVADDLFQLDYLYVSSWSMWWDLKILWDTPRAMIRGLGAY